MNAVRRAIEFYEHIDPQEARRAWLEFEALLENTPQYDRTALIKVNGVKHRVIGRETIGAFKVGDCYLEAVPVVIVEKKGATPPKQL